MATESAGHDALGVSSTEADAPLSVLEFELPPEEALGLTFAPPRDGVIRGGLSIRVVDNARFQPAVEIGDLVVTINGEPLDGVGYAAAVERIRTLPRPLVICIEVDEPRRARARIEKQRADQNWEFTLTTYAVAFEESPMGINLEDATRYDIVGAAIRATKGAARNTRQIAIGDILVKVNNTNVLWMPYKEVMDAVRNAPSPRTLLFVPKDMHADVVKLSISVGSNGAVESAAEEARRERDWDEANAADNLEALRTIRRCLPVNVKTMSECDLQQVQMPSGKWISREMARKFKRTNVLELLRVNPSEITAAHPSMLESLRMVGLTVTERRALYHHLREVGKVWEAGQHDELTKRKWEWFQRMKETCRRVVDAYQQHVTQYGPAGNHPYATSEHPGLGCPLEGKQCPIKANSAPAYDDDLGFPDGDEFMESLLFNDSTCGSEISEREDARLHPLKQHYNRNVRRVAEANGACEVMERMLNKIHRQQLSLFQTRLEHQQNGAETRSAIRQERELWIELVHEVRLAVETCADRAGLNCKDTQGNPPPESLDTRSSFECKLAILLCEAVVDCVAGIDDRLAETGVTAECVLKAIAQVRARGVQLKERSLATLSGMDDKGPSLELQSKTRAELLGEASENLRAASQPCEIGEGSVSGGGARGGNDGMQRDPDSASLFGLRAAAVAELKQTMTSSSGSTSIGRAGATSATPTLGALTVRTGDVSIAIGCSALLPGSTFTNSKLLGNDDRVYWRGRHWIWRRLVRFLQRLWRKATRRLQ